MSYIPLQTVTEYLKKNHFPITEMVLLYLLNFMPWIPPCFPQIFLIPSAETVQE